MDTCADGDADDGKSVDGGVDVQNWGKPEEAESRTKEVDID